MRLARCLALLENQAKPDDVFHVYSGVFVVGISCALRVFSGYSGFPPSWKVVNVKKLISFHNLYSFLDHYDIKWKLKTMEMER